MTIDAVRLRAPAKVNLGLEVLGRRDDGYHELRTTMLAVGLSDELHLALEAEGGADAIELAGPALSSDVPADGRNLALRAVDLARHAARAQGLARAERRVTLRLTKRVPSAAGLGGGSSDAAAALRGAAQLFGAELAPGRALELLATLGSDCPFFHGVDENPLASCTGRGERVTAVPHGGFPWWIAILTPAVTCSTAAVYGARAIGEYGPGAAFDIDRVLAGSLDEARAALVNDLEAAALSVANELSAWRTALAQAGADHFRLSGSGSSLFGLYRDRHSAERDLSAVANRATARDLALRGRWCVRAWEGGGFRAHRK